MDAAEAVFQRLARLWRRLRTPAVEAAPGEVRLADHRARLTMLATLLSGENLELGRADDDVGAVIGNTLLLPSRMALFPRSEANLDAYRVRIAFSCTCRALGFHVPPELDDPLGRAVATLLAVPATRAQMEIWLPQGARTAQALWTELVDQRPAVSPSTLGGVLELWTRRRLADNPASHDTADGGAKRLLERALASRPTTPAALHEATRELVAELRAAFPGAPGELPPGVPLWGRLAPAATAPSTQTTEDLPAAPSPSVGERRVIQIDRTVRLRRHTHERREDKPLYHLFEKVHTAEEHRGEGGTPEEDGDLQQMEDALSELSLGTVIRTTEDPRNLARLDVVMDDNDVEVTGEPQEEHPRTFLYPEWDFRKARYREDYCTLIERRLLPEGSSSDHALVARRLVSAERRHVDQLRMHLVRSLYRRRMKRGQLDGPDIDVEAMVDRHAALVAGCTPPERLYVAGRRALREIAVLVLVDTSFSTDAWLEGRRVLDVAIQSLLVLAEAFSGHLEEEVAVASFSSHTRHRVHFGVLKGFEDGWNVLHHVAPALVPGGYTRIGAALRHGTTVLDATRARQKILVLLSDGKPTDYDRYEGRYGIEDVSQAVREATQQQVQVFGLAIEKEAKTHLARMLGPGGYRILPRTSLLPDAMADLLVGLLTR